MESDATEWAVEMQLFDEDRTLDELPMRTSSTTICAQVTAIVPAMRRATPNSDAASWVAALAALLHERIEKIVGFRYGFVGGFHSDFHY